MLQNTMLYSDWVPELHKDIDFYHDTLLDRWVVSGTCNIVFLNHDSYEVIRRCNGKNNFRSICQNLCETGIFTQDKVQEKVTNIIKDFSNSGFIINGIN